MITFIHNMDGEFHSPTNSIYVMVVGSIPEIIHILVRGRRFDPLIIHI